MDNSATPRPRRRPFVRVRNGCGGDARAPGNHGGALATPGRDPDEIIPHHRLIIRCLPPMATHYERSREARAPKNDNQTAASPELVVRLGLATGTACPTIDCAPMAFATDQIILPQQSVRGVCDRPLQKLGRSYIRGIFIQHCDEFGKADLQCTSYLDNTNPTEVHYALQLRHPRSRKVGNPSCVSAFHLEKFSTPRIRTN